METSGDRFMMTDDLKINNMADKNCLNCVVCGKRDRIMKRCRRCQSIFYCSVECQRADWGKHKTDCCIIKMQKSGGGEMSLAMKLGKAFDATGQTTKTKCKTVDCKLQELELDKNAGQDLHTIDTNVKHLVENCQVNTSQTQVDVDPAESLLNGHVQASGLIENIQKVKQQTETIDELTELKGNEKSVVADVGRRDLSTGNHEVGKESHVPTTWQDDISKVVVYVKYAKEKHKVEIDLPCTGLQALKHFSRVLRVPLERLKLIHKGKLQTESIIVERLKPNSVFLAFGEMAECEEGLEAEDIDLIMKQLSVERNVAIKALRKTNCLIDAIFEIGNDM